MPTTTEHLFVLRSNEPAACREAARSLEERGFHVLAELGNHAIIAAGPAANAPHDDRFALVTSRAVPAKAALDALDDEARRSIRAWNVLCRERRALSKAKRPERTFEISCGGPRRYRLDRVRSHLPPEAKSAAGRDAALLDRSSLDAIVAKLTLEGAPEAGAVRDEALLRKGRSALREIALALPPASGAHLATLASTNLWSLLVNSAGMLGPTPELTGRITMGIVRVSSSIPGEPTLDATLGTLPLTKGDLLYAHTIGAGNLLAAQHPAKKLEWVYEVRDVHVPITPDPTAGNAVWWRDIALEAVTYFGSSYTVGSLRAARPMAFDQSALIGQPLVVRTEVVGGASLSLFGGTLDVTVTFVAGAGGGLTRDEVVAQINATFRSTFPTLTGDVCSLTVDRVVFDTSVALDQRTIASFPTNLVGTGTIDALLASMATTALGFFANEINARSAQDAFRRDLAWHNDTEHAIIVVLSAFRGDETDPSTGTTTSYNGVAQVEAQVAYAFPTWLSLSFGSGVIAHEICHLFGALDEYKEGDAGDFGGHHIPNGNHYQWLDPSGAVLPQLPCMMTKLGSYRLCGFTRAQIGWGHVLCEIATSSEVFSGTDDEVHLDIGERQFLLDTPEPVYDPLYPVSNDHEAGMRGSYAFYAPEITPADLKRILVRKSPDGALGGWKPAWIRLWFLGETTGGNNVHTFTKWLEDEHLVETPLAKDPDLVNYLFVTVWTSSDPFSGTNDDVTFEMAGRTFVLDKPTDDFETGSQARYELDPGVGLRISDIHSLRIRKSADGALGSWKLKGVRVEINTDPTPFFEKLDIETWLTNGNLFWETPI